MLKKPFVHETYPNPSVIEAESNREHRSLFQRPANDVPISFMVRRIEIEMPIMLGAETNLKRVEASDRILF